MRGLCSRHSAVVQLWPEKCPCSCAVHSHSSWEYMPLYQGGAMKVGLSGKGQESLSSGRKQERASWRQCAHLTAFSSSLHTALVSTSPTHLFTTPASLLTSSFLPLPPFSFANLSSGSFASSCLGQQVHGEWATSRDGDEVVCHRGWW